jgi:hypothetical protein
MSTFEEFPLSLLDDPFAYSDWQEEVGTEEAKRQMTDATRQHMRVHGPRSAIDVAEKMAHVTATLEEFVL